MVKKYKIGVLGLGTYGKTIYLTALNFLLNRQLHPKIKLVSESDVVLRYLPERIELLEKKEWNEACNQIAATFGDISNLSFTIQVKDSVHTEYELTLMDYAGESVRMDWTLNGMTSEALIDFMKECDGFMIFIAAHKLNQNGVLENLHEQSYRLFINQIKDFDKKKPFAMVISQGDRVTEDTNTYPFGKEPVNVWSKMVFDGFARSIREPLNWENPKRNNQKLFYVTSSKLCVDAINKSHINWARDAANNPMIDLTSPLIGLINHLDENPLPKYVSITPINNLLEKSIRKIWHEEFDILNKKVTTYGNSILESDFNLMTQHVQRSISKKKDDINYLLNKKPPYLNEDQENFFNSKIIALMNTTSSLAEFNKIKAQFGIL